MRNSYYYTFLILFTLVFLIAGCGDKGKTDSEAKKPAENEKPMADIASLVDGGALMAASEEAGAAENNEGVGHFKEGHWDVSEKHFMKAIETNPDLAEGHYNLALTLDKLESHVEATKHFGKALELAPDNPKIKESKILKAHLGM